MIESLKNYFTSLNAAERENFAKSVNMNVQHIGHIYRGGRLTSIEGAILIDKFTDSVVKMEELRPDFDFDYVRRTAPTQKPYNNTAGKKAQELLIEWLLSGKPLTQETANRVFNSVRVTPRIAELRKKGYPIDSYADADKRAIYFLPKEFITMFNRAGPEAAIAEFKQVAKAKATKIVKAGLENAKW